MDCSFTIPKLLSKALSDGYISINKPTIVKSCHSIDNNILIFLDPRLVEHFGIRDGTQFEQISTEEGILLRQRKQRRD